MLSDFNELCGEKHFSGVIQPLRSLRYSKKGGSEKNTASVRGAIATCEYLNVSGEYLQNIIVAIEGFRESCDGLFKLLAEGSFRLRC